MLFVNREALIEKMYSQRSKYIAAAVSFLAGYLFTGITILLVTSVQSSPIVKAENSKVLNASEQNVTMLFVGDVMLGRYVETLRAKNSNDYPFEKIDELLVSRDVNFGNLEGPIVEDAKQTPNNSTRFAFKEDMAELLTKHNFNLVSLANNHTFDFGAEGFDDTMEYLSAQDIDFVGHPKDVSQGQVLKKELQGQEFTFIAFNAFSSTFDEELALELVQNLNKGSNNFIIVSIHWGNEYQRQSSTRQQQLAHKLIDEGANLIIGQHPHVVQEVETYNNKLIFYSLGNFIFDQYFSKYTQEGLAVELEIESNNFTYKLRPFDILKSQPQLKQGDDLKVWLEDLASRSSAEMSEDIKNGVVVVSNN